MALRLFLDHCVPTSVGRALEPAGHEVLLLREHLPPDTEDPAVLAKASALDAVLVTLDGDFADLVRYPPSAFGGIVALQVRNRPEALPLLMERLQAYLAAHPEQAHYRGKLLLVDPTRIRLRT